MSDTTTQEAGLTVKEFLNASMFDPTYYIETCFKVSLSNQQKEMADNFAKFLLDRYYKHMLNEGTITLEQIPDFIKDFETVRYNGIVISSGRGIGKSAFIALIAIWLMHCFRNAKLLIIAPTENQLRDITVSEMRLWLDKLDNNNKFIYPFRNLVQLNMDGLSFTGNNSKCTFKPVGQNMSSEQLKAALSGRHSFINITIIDEAISQSKETIQTFVASATDPVSFMLMMSNPVEWSYFVEIVFDPQVEKNWKTFVMSYEDSSRASPDAIDRLKQEYGEDSAEYAANVRGIYMTSTAEKLYNDHWTLACIKSRKSSENKVVSVGFDPASDGDDASPVALFHDLHLIEFEDITGKDGMEKTYNLCEYLSDNNVQVCGIDTIGPGLSIYEESKKILPSVVFRPLKNSNSSNRPDKFLNSRAESMWELRAMLEKGLISFEPTSDIKKSSYFQQFRKELSVIQYEKRNGKISIMGKSKLRSKLGGKSTDFLDAVLNALYKNQYIKPEFLKMKIQPSIERQLFKERYREPETNHWMEF